MRRSILRPDGTVLLLVAGLVVGGCDLLDKVTDPASLSIRRFDASPEVISPGGSVTLSWDVDGATTVTIDNGVGTVQDSGSRSLRPDWTTSYTLTAQAGSSSATATVQVVVQPSPSPSPTPKPSPTPLPTPSPSPTPTPSPSPTPSPTPTPTPTPTPSPTPTPVTCGSPAGLADNCSVTIAKPSALPAGQCIELNLVTVNQSCPVNFNTTRSVRFDVTAHTSKPSLTWRRSTMSSDVLTPNGGTLSGDGVTSVVVGDIVLDSTVTIEIVDGGAVLLSFTLRHY